MLIKSNWEYCCYSSKVWRKPIFVHYSSFFRIGHSINVIIPYAISSGCKYLMFWIRPNIKITVHIIIFESKWLIVIPNIKNFMYWFEGFKHSKKRCCMSETNFSISYSVVFYPLLKHDHRHRFAQLETKVAPS